MFKYNGFINSMSFPKTIKQFEFNMTKCDEYFNVLDIITSDEVGWTVNDKVKLGDLCFFMHTYTAINNINAIRQELLNKPELKNQKYLLTMIEKATNLYNKYGGKIFAIGQVISEPFSEDDDDRVEKYWSSKLYAGIKIVKILKKPIHYDLFKDFIKLNYGAITNLSQEQLTKLIDVVETTNDIKII